MHAFVWMLSSIIIPLAFLVVAGIIVIYKLNFTTDITPEMRALPPRIFILVALLDAIGNLLTTIPSPHVAGPIQVLVAQVIIPVNVGLSLIFLKSRYGTPFLLPSSPPSLLFPSFLFHSIPYSPTPSSHPLPPLPYPPLPSHSLLLFTLPPVLFSLLFFPLFFSALFCLPSTMDGPCDDITRLHWLLMV
eukprot:TRINITY_DN10928_c0_g1_i1.p1 TRINITY_DN10928_c0_g1~~TRINITY_DN10928_c0_g1_i1.p1  ORF type:complete len:219 (+),score=34.00 TRINITY_DN10928_c0_g1_i1:92-658(+)